MAIMKEGMFLSFFAVGEFIIHFYKMFVKGGGTTCYTSKADSSSFHNSRGLLYPDLLRGIVFM